MVGARVALRSTAPSVGAARTRGDRKGMALVFVLWMLVLLGLAVAELARRSRAETHAVMALRARAVAQYAAESGVLATTVALRSIVESAPEPAALAEQLRRLDTLGRASGRLVTGSGRSAVAVLDLNARLDLAHADSTALRNLFAEFVSGERAETIVRALRQTPVTQFAELARVAGADDALALAVAPYVTVAGDGLVNVNDAPEPVLAALPGIGPVKARSLVERRSAGALLNSVDSLRPTNPTGAPVAVDGLLVTTVPTRVMIVSRGWQQGFPMTREIQAVYLVLGGRLRLMSWVERER